MRFLRSYRPVTLAGLFCVLTAQPVLAAGNLTLPFNIPNPTVTSWMDHHFPTRQSDGIMIRFDGATGYAYDGHRGIDYAVPSNTPVVAADDGTVTYSEWSNDGGWGVVIEHATDRTAYFHNTRLFVYEGQHVSRGQLIALSGSTGNSTGPHVHFEARDLQTNWHSIDPYGWTGKGPDPWSYDEGYLFTSNPPVPFLLPLAIFGGARWDHWYGADGPPPPVTWQLRQGQYALAGSAAKWDADPGVDAARTQALSGTVGVPGPGSHTLHLRVWDRAGRTADLTYLYLYDVDPPTGSASTDRVSSSAISLHWSGKDTLSGINDVSVEVSRDGAAFRPWLQQSVDQPSAGTSLGGARFLGQAGSSYQFRVTLRDAARNAAPPVAVSADVPASAAAPATVNDQAILGALPDVPAGSVRSGGLRQEHPWYGGALALGGDASVQGLGATSTAPTAAPGSSASAVDIATTNAGSFVLLSDGSTWSGDGSQGPRFRVNAPVRLLAGLRGELMAIGSDGGVALPGGRSAPGVYIGNGAVITDAALFPGLTSGLMLDSFGTIHSFSGADPALPFTPSSWTLPGSPAGLALAGSADAPAGIVTDTSGDWQSFGSLLLLPAAMFRGPAFDPATGLPIR